MVAKITDERNDEEDRDHFAVHIGEAEKTKILTNFLNGKLWILFFCRGKLCYHIVKKSVFLKSLTE